MIYCFTNRIYLFSFRLTLFWLFVAECFNFRILYLPVFILFYSIHYWKWTWNSFIKCNIYPLFALTRGHSINDEDWRSWHRVSKISLDTDFCLTLSKSLERPTTRFSDQWDAVLSEEFERLEFVAKCTVEIKSIKKDIDQVIDNMEKILKNKDSAKSSK